jgi:hypothetical protein
MMILHTTTPDTDDDHEQDEKWRREALSVHAESEKVLRVVFTVADRGPRKPHRYYRAILRGLGGKFHLAGGHVRVVDGSYVEDTSAGCEPPFWVKRRCGLRRALHAVNSFVPGHRSGDAHIATQFLEGRRKCQTLWRLMKKNTTTAHVPAPARTPGSTM